MKSIFVKNIYFLFLLSILFVSLNNDSDINWLYKYSKDSAYYVDAFNKNTINSTHNNDKTEFTYFGNLQKTIIISSTFSKRWRFCFVINTFSCSFSFTGLAYKRE